MSVVVAVTEPLLVAQALQGRFWQMQRLLIVLVIINALAKRPLLQAHLFAVAPEVTVSEEILVKLYGRTAPQPFLGTLKIALQGRQALGEPALI